MIRLFFWFGMTCGIPVMYSQTLSPTLLGSAGAHAVQASFGSLDWSVGETVVNTFSPAPGSASVLTQGFHQVFVSLVTEAHETESADFLPLVYPNPAQGWVQVESPEPARVRLWSISGIALFSFDAVSDSHTLSLNGIPSGTYLLEVVPEDKQTGKIFKLQIIQ